MTDTQESCFKSEEQTLASSSTLSVSQSQPSRLPQHRGVQFSKAFLSEQEARICISQNRTFLSTVQWWCARIRNNSWVSHTHTHYVITQAMLKLHSCPLSPPTHTHTASIKTLHNDGRLFNNLCITIPQPAQEYLILITVESEASENVKQHEILSGLFTSGIASQCTYCMKNIPSSSRTFEISNIIDLNFWFCCV